MKRRQRKRRKLPSRSMQTDSHVMSRRERRRVNRTLAVLGSLAILVLGAMIWHVADDVSADLIVYIPGEGSVTATSWVNMLRASGFHVHVVKDSNPVLRRERLHVPKALVAEVSTLTVNPSRYVLAGYVPPEAIRRMLREHPSFHGLAVLDSPQSISAASDTTASRSGVEVWGYWSDGYKEPYLIPKETVPR